VTYAGKGPPSRIGGQPAGSGAAPGGFSHKGWGSVHDPRSFALPVATLAATALAVQLTTIIHAVT